MAQVELIELETIRKFSVATRGATALMEEVVAALRADLDALTQDASQLGQMETEAETSDPVRRTSHQAPRQRATLKRTTGGRSGGRKRSRVS